MKNPVSFANRIFHSFHAFFLFFRAAGLEKREDQGADKENEEDDLHGTERFFATHKLSPLLCFVAVVSLHYSPSCVPLSHPTSDLTNPEFLTFSVGMEKVEMPGNPAMESGDA